MDQSPAAGQTHQQWLQRMQHAQPHNRVASVENVEPAGQNQLKIYHTGNTNGIQTSQILRRVKKNIQASREAQATSEQSTSEQSLEHRGPRSTSNGRASKAFP